MNRVAVGRTAADLLHWQLAHSVTDHVVSYSPSLDDQGHVLLVRQPRGLLAHPEAVVDREGVYRHREVLRVDLGELLATGVVFEEGVEHLVGDLLGTGPVDLVDLLGVGVVGVKAPDSI